MALDLPADETGFKLSSRYAERTKHLIEPEVVAKQQVPVKEVVRKGIIL